MKNKLFIFLIIALIFSFNSCTDSSDEATWGTVNKKFVELEKERAQTFELLKEKPNKSNSNSESETDSFFCFISAIRKHK